MARPLIGVTNSGVGALHLGNAYFEALWEAGACPVLLPNQTDWVRTEEYADQFAGFLFSGGVDVDPKYYMEERSPKCGEISAERDSFELALLTSVMLRRKPVLGICRGIQLLNVGLGGSLFQHIEGHVDRTDKGPDVWHEVTVRQGTLLYDIVGKTALRVNSTHHQAVKGNARSLQIAAESPEGYTESVYMKDHPFLLGVQWHPERFYKDDSSASAIFDAFVAAAGK